MPWHTDRLVELKFRDGGQGSGFLISSRHILTARHVSTDLRHVGSKCSVRLMKVDSAQPRPASIAATVAWGDEGLDIAVVQLDSDTPLEGREIRFGEIMDIRPMEFFFTGFPEGAGQDTKTVKGTISYVPTAGRYDLDYHTATLSSVELWAGVSGSMVFHGDYAVGVVRTVSRKWDRAFTATPLHLLFAHQGFQTYWRTQRQTAVRLTKLGNDPAPPPRPVERDLSALLAWCDRTDEYRAISRLTEAQEMPVPHLFGLAGHEHHGAPYIVQRLVEELRLDEHHVWHINLERHPDFKSIDELNRTIRENADFELGVKKSPKLGEQLARCASEGKWTALLLSAPIDCDRWGTKGTRERLEIVAAWLDCLRRFPCPVVFTVILRWSGDSKPGWISRLFGTREPQLDQVRLTEVRAIWREFQQTRGDTSPGDESSLCVLDGYLPWDVKNWLGLRHVQASLEERVVDIRSKIDTWFGPRPRMNFTELQIELSKL